MSLVLSISDREVLRRRQRNVKGEAYAEAVGRRYLSIFIVLLWGMLCICALFIVSEKFVNPEITPKRFGLVAGTCVAAVAWTVCCRRPVVPGRPVFLLLLFCVSAVLLRDRAFMGFDNFLPVYSCCLLLLFFILRQMAVTAAAAHLFTATLVLSAFLALYGILQYTGPTFGRYFTVTGTFDNPAGFAAVLSSVFPYGFYFFRRSVRPVVKLSIAGMLALLAAGIVLSGSRSAMTACLAAAAIYAMSRYSGIMIRRPIRIVAACLAVAAVFGFYRLKKDSADGRLLIWQCTADMIREAPITGHGQGAFAAKYMTYQAAYFQAHPESRYTQLADNVTHPFNEYLLILSEHGIIGLCVLAVALFLLCRAYFRTPGREKFIAALSLLSVAVFSFFSYPFRYPFTWLIVLLNMAMICRTDGKPLHGRPAAIAGILTVAFAGFLLWRGSVLMKAEIRWNGVARQSLAGRTVEMLPEYDRLYPYLGKNGLFLYNQAAELHEAGEFERSIAVFERCTHHYNDMDVQMLLADNYKQLGRYAEAERHFKTAANMCPARFMPLYELTKLYDAVGRRDEALAMAKKIIDKEVKVPSSTITAIKNDMRNRWEAKEPITDNLENENRTSDQPKNNGTRQGGTPEAWPHGAALPP